uniref:NAD-dependent epimerase/dehydratase domain-containing protein n=1 Tax=Ananas comosus var. bracteatus TaxID=296719 RepID=A0A6V7P453_ANACO|nr:unnamed protein product [Ananas comosus var. bracteatus]
MRAVKMGGEAAEEEGFPSTPGKVKMERGGPGSTTGSCSELRGHLVPLPVRLLGRPPLGAPPARLRPPRAARDGLCVLVTGAAGFVGSHASLALRRRGDGVLGLDNFNPYYDPSLKRARQSLLASHGVFVVEGDLNDAPLLARLFAAAPFTHVLHLAAQAGVRYALENPASYVRSNVAGLVALLEACRAADPQPAVVWASSSSVYGLNDKVPFSESDPTDRPASLYAATKKAGEEITHAYNHIYGLSVTGLRFFTVYGPWGRPDMAYFFFARAILQGKPITVYARPRRRRPRARLHLHRRRRARLRRVARQRAAEHGGRAGRKRGEAQYRIYNWGTRRRSRCRRWWASWSGTSRPRRAATSWRCPATATSPSPRQHLARPRRARLQAHHQSRRRPQEVRQMVPLLLRLHLPRRLRPQQQAQRRRRRAAAV